MLGDSDLVAFLATTDAPRARVFYEGVLGLRFVSDDPFAVVYNVQGIELRLIDQLGNERTAIDYLAREKGLKSDTPVRDWQLRSRLGDLSMLHMATTVVLEAVGLGTLARRFETWGTIQAVERLNLDGLLALWHPPAAN